MLRERWVAKGIPVQSYIHHTFAISPSSINLHAILFNLGAKKTSGFDATDSQPASQPAPQLTDAPASSRDTEQQLQQLRVRLEPLPLQAEAAGALPGSSGSGGGGGGSGGSGTESGLPLGLKIAWRRLLKEVASLPLAISIMFAIAGLSGLGTLIPQNKVGPPFGARAGREEFGGGCQAGRPGAMLVMLAQGGWCFVMDDIYT